MFDNGSSSRSRCIGYLISDGSARRSRYIGCSVNDESSGQGAQDAC